MPAPDAQHDPKLSQDPYKLGPDALSPPDLPGAVRFSEDPEEVRDMLTSDLYARALSSVGATGSFHIALAIDDASERLIMKLMVDPKYRGFPWDATHVWSVREPIAHPDDPSHSAARLTETLIEPSGMPEDNLHVIHAHLPDACERASAEMLDHLRARGVGRDTLDAAVIVPDPELMQPNEDPAGRLYGHTPSKPTPSIMLSSRALQSATLIAVLGFTHDHWAAASDIAKGAAPCAYAQHTTQLRWYLHPTGSHDEPEHPEPSRNA